MNIRDLLIRLRVSTSGTEGALDKVNDRVEKVKHSFEGLGQIISLMAAGATVRSLINLADKMQNLQSQVANSTGDIAGASAKLDELAQHANLTRTGLDAYTDSWAKMNLGIQRFGGTTDDTTKFTDTLSAAFRVNGTAAESSRAALFQLGQTMQSGVVQGEEMNSFLDAQGTLANEVMVEIGGTVPAYKKMQQAGKVTAKMLMDAVNKQYPKYIEAVKKMPLTVGDAWQQIRNDFSLSVNHINNQMNIIPRIARKILDVWNKMKAVASELVQRLGGLENAFKHLIQTATPLLALFGALTAFKALAFLTSPIGMILALAGAIGLLYDDYKTWKAGGESLIDWDKWKPEIDAAKKGLGMFRDAIKWLTGEDDTLKAGFKGLAAYIGGAWAVRVLSVLSGLNSAFAKTPLGIAIAGGMLASTAWDKMNGNPDDTVAGRYSWLQKGSKAEALVGGIEDSWNNYAPDFLKNVRWNTNSPGYGGNAGGSVSNNNSGNVTINVNMNSSDGDPQAIGRAVKGVLPGVPALPGMGMNSFSSDSLLNHSGGN